MTPALLQTGQAAPQTPEPLGFTFGIVHAELVLGCRVLEQLQTEQSSCETLQYAQNTHMRAKEILDALPKRPGLVKKARVLDPHLHTSFGIRVAIHASGLAASRGFNVRTVWSEAVGEKPDFRSAYLLVLEPGAPLRSPQDGRPLWEALVCTDETRTAAWADLVR